MSLKNNLIAGYASQIVTTALGILTVPILISLMGVESYGLIGLFVVLQGWFALLDAGFSPALARESSRLSAGVVSIEQYNMLSRRIALLFFIVGAFICAIVILASQTVASQWLAPNQLSEAAVANALVLMAPSLGIRFSSSFYRAIISGFERLVWLSTISTMIALARFFLVIPLLYYYKSSVSTYFIYQLIVSILEICLLRYKAISIKCNIESNNNSYEDIDTGKFFRFAASFGFATIAWVFVSQSDRLILSAILPLADYGTFTVITLAASAVMLIASPTGSVIIPRLTHLYAQARYADVLEVYTLSARYVAMGSALFASVLMLNSHDVLFAWTGKHNIASNGHVLSLYSAGNAILTMTGFAMFIQSAVGNVQVHLRGQIAFALLIVPFITISALKYGMTGAGAAWFIGNLVYFIIYVPLVHKIYLPGQHRRWLTNITIAMCPSLISISFLRLIISPATSRIGCLLNITAAVIVGAVASIIALPWLRAGVTQIVKNKGRA